MKKKMVILGMALLLAGCTKTPDSLLKDVKVNKATTEKTLTNSETEKMADFAVALLKKGNRKDNELVCPYSLANVLGMAAIGADGETQSDIEALIGDPQHMIKPATEVKNANAIWFRDDLKPRKAFLSDCKTFYDAEAYMSDMKDSALSEINAFVSAHTDKMIPEIIQSVPKDAQMILVNATAFEADWETPYTGNDVLKETFTNAAGGEEEGDFLSKEEHLFIDGDACKGFIKPYRDRNQLFVALLPDADWDLESFIETLSGRTWMSLLGAAEEKSVFVSMPKFEVDKKFAATKAIKGLGVKAPFDPQKANFSGIAKNSDGLFISQIEHRCLLKVDEEGTKAGAASAVTIDSAVKQEGEEIFLNKPFVYAVVDAETHVPIFIGALRSLY